MQAAVTVDRNYVVAKWVDLVDTATNASGQFTAQSSDIFMAVLSVSLGRWSYIGNITQSDEYDLSTFIPDIVPNDLKDIPILKLSTIPDPADQNPKAADLLASRAKFLKSGNITLDKTIIDGVNDDNINNNLNILGIYPNPATENASIKYNLSTNSNISIEIFDVLGNKVETLLNKNVNAGPQQFTFNLEDIPSGVYYCTLNSNGKKVTKPLTIIR